MDNNDSPKNRVRLVVKEDLPSIFVIEQEQPFPWSKQSLQSCLSHPYQGFVLEEGSKVIGFGIISLAADECEIHNIAIAPSHRRQGHGRRLLQHLLSAAKQQGAVHIYLEVRASNSAARKLYESAGFKSVGLRKGYYPTVSGREDAVVLHKFVAKTG